ncbi:MAG: Ig-like domain-containing protein [Halobacteriota archaeon]
MFAEKRGVFVVAVVLVISALLFVNAAPVVKALQPTTTTITTSKTNPTLNQPFTLSGTLKAGSTPLSGKSILLGRTDPSGQWSSGGTTTTDANGAYTFTQSESGQGKYWYQAVFSGDTTYAASNAMVSVTVGSA